MINPVITIILLFLLGFLAPLLFKKAERLYKAIILLVFLFNITEFIIIIPSVIQTPVQVFMSNIIAPFGIMITFGLSGSILALMINLIAFAIVLFKLNSAHNSDNPTVFYTVFPILIGALISLLNTQDIFNMFVFVEIVTISVYILSGLKQTQTSDISTLKFITGTSLGSLLILIGIGGIYALTGTLNIPHIVAMINGYATFNLHLFNISVLMILIGLMFEAYIFPFNIFVIGIYRSSQTLNGAIYSGLIQSVILFVTVKLIYFLINNPVFLNIIIIAGIVTIGVSQFSAFASKNKKSMLAFSSFSVSGLLISLTAIAVKSGMKNEIFTLIIMMIIIHGVSKFIMFMASDRFVDEKGYILKGKAAGPFSLLAFIAGALTLSGLPPFPGFYIKFRILTELLRMNYGWMIIVILISALLEIIYLLKTAREFSLHNAAEEGEPVFSMLPSILTLIIILLFTVNADYMYRASNNLDFTEEMQQSVSIVKNNIADEGSISVNPNKE